MPSKKKQSDVINTYSDNLYISRQKLFTYIFTTIIGTAIATSVTIIGVANTDHFSIAANDRRIGSIEENYVPRREIELQLNVIIKSIDNLSEKIDTLSGLRK